jgi:hypothetical protein
LEWRKHGAVPPDKPGGEAGYQLLDVLASAHGKGIVHRDIKPENLFLTREGTLKVLDFGVARLLERSVSVTRSGGVLGTPAFMAPEQVLAKTKEVDAQSDLWSVGATAFTLLSGHYVHEAETAEEMMVFTASRPARPLSSVLPNVPPALAKVVDRALLTSRAERWPDARAMQAAVARAYQDAFGAPLPGAASTQEDKTAVMFAPAQARAVPRSVPPTQYAPPSEAQRGVAERAPPAEVGTTAPMRLPTTTGVAATWTKRFMVSGRDGAGGRGRLATPLLVAIAVTAAVLGAGIIIAAAGSRRESTPVAASPTREAPATVASSHAVAEPAPSATVGPIPPAKTEPPTISVEALPTMTHPTSVAPRAPTTKPTPAPAPSPVAAPAAPAPQVNCSPPFTLDAKGIKKWKAECL